MMWWHDGTGWGGWIAMILTVISFWALVVFGVIAISRGRPEGGAHREDDRDPMRVLDERLADGDIDVEEYEARREALRTGH